MSKRDMIEPGKLPTPRDAAEARDLRNTLLFGGLSVVCFGTMILASGRVLQIPRLANSVVALAGVAVAAGGLGALRMNWPVRRVGWIALVAYVLVISLAVHFTGGPLTPMPALYLLVVVAASFVLGRRGAAIVAVISVACYAAILALEYAGTLSMVQIWRLAFVPRERGLLLIVNWLAVSIPTLVTSQLAGSLAERLKKTNVQLRESERLRENLTQMVVHDLRNPLVGLLGWLKLLQSDGTGDVAVVRNRLLNNAHRSGQVLLDMVSELLDISKMEAGRLKLYLNLVDLRDLVSESVDSMRALIEIEELEVRTELCKNSAIVACDRQLISRVLANLLANAIKHTPTGGAVTLAVRPHANNVFQVSVADTGSGIPPQHLHHIFEKFAQVEQFENQRHGTGLGLTFCKMAVEAHGGRIWAESQLGQGSTFFFNLPVSGSAVSA